MQADLTKLSLEMKEIRIEIQLTKTKVKGCKRSEYRNAWTDCQLKNLLISISAKLTTFPFSEPHRNEVT